MFKTKCKVLIAFFLDALVFVISFSLLTLFLNNCIIKNVTDYNTWASECNQVLLESGIYEKKGTSIELIEDNIDNRLIVFYQNNTYYDEKKETISYEDAKEKSGLFHKNSSGDYVLNEGVSEEDIDAFYENELYKARIVITNNPRYKNAKKSIDDVDTITTYCSMIVITAILMIVIPLCNKKRVTLGQKIIKLSLYSDYEELKVVQIIVRYIAFIAIELLPSLTFYGITFIISTLLMFFTKRNKFICDFFASTYLSEVEYNEIETKN